jgi:hypothetical protein
LLARRIGRPFDGDEHDEFTHKDRNTVSFYGDKIFEVGTCRINFTTYDNRRDYNVINPKTHPDVMVFSGDQDEPFWYARVMGVFHARVMVTHEQAAHKGWEWMPFLFVRWFGAEPGYTPGFDVARMPKIGFVQWEADRDNYPFGFLDPAEILRGCHLIPTFHSGRTTELLPHDCAVARQVKAEHQDSEATGATEDWTNYYVNMCVYNLHYRLLFNPLILDTDSSTVTWSCDTSAEALVTIPS